MNAHFQQVWDSNFKIKPNIYFMKKTIFILSAIVIGSFFTNCSDNDADTDTDPIVNTLNQEILTNISVSVITETYKDIYDNAEVLETAVSNFTLGDATNLEAIKKAWQKTRAPWEKSEGFLYGPVDTEGIDPAIDSWPVDINAINNALNSTKTINSALLESNNEARGFHTIEYLVWGLKGQKTADDFTPREIEYLKAATQNLKEKTKALYFGWLRSEGDFAGNFINASQPGSAYVSQKAAFQEIVEGMVTIADEVANGKIETPLNGNGGSPKPSAEESRFSNNSKLDFANNIKSIQNIYLGTYTGNPGKGISTIVGMHDKALDDNMKAAINDAIIAIESIPGTFTDAIVNDREAVAQAQQKVTKVMTLLEDDVVKLISALN